MKMQHSYTHVHTTEVRRWTVSHSLANTFIFQSHGGYMKTSDTATAHACHRLTRAQPRLGASPGPGRTQSHEYDHRTPDTDSGRVPRTDTQLPASEPHREVKQRLLLGPTNSYTNVLLWGHAHERAQCTCTQPDTPQSHPDTHHTWRHTSRSRRLRAGRAHSV